MEIKEISNAFYLSRNTVRKYVRAFQESGLSLEKVLGMSDEHLYGMFVGAKSRTGEPSERRIELDALLPEYAARLKQKGVTLQIIIIMINLFIFHSALHLKQFLSPMFFQHFLRLLLYSNMFFLSSLCRLCKKQ